MLPALYLLIGLIIGQRLGELWLARRNTRLLLARGGIEVGKGHYPLFFVVQIAWLAAMIKFIPPFAPPFVPLLILFLALQVARLWVIATLGMFWTTRIITVPGAPLIKDGPFKYVRHPNYLVVAGEIAVLPLMFRAWRIALVFSVLSALLTLYRIRVEEAALAEPALMPLAKRSLRLAGHATSLALEPEFWAVLEMMAHARHTSLAALVREIDQARGADPLASACRVAALTRSAGERTAV